MQTVPRNPIGGLLLRSARKPQMTMWVSSPSGTSTSSSGSSGSRWATCRVDRMELTTATGALSARVARLAFQRTDRKRQRLRTRPTSEARRPNANHPIFAVLFPDFPLQRGGSRSPSRAASTEAQGPLECAGEMSASLMVRSSRWIRLVRPGYMADAGRRRRGPPRIAHSAPLLASGKAGP
jgi:hypothetical protein